LEGSPLKVPIPRDDSLRASSVPIGDLQCLTWTFGLRWL